MESGCLGDLPFGVLGEDSFGDLTGVWVFGVLAEDLGDLMGDFPLGVLGEALEDTTLGNLLGVFFVRLVLSSLGD